MHPARRFTMAAANVLVSEVMTVIPHPVRVNDTLALAAERMSTLGVHHLPVLADFNLVGVLSDHDLALARGLGVDLAAVSVGVAMTAGPYVVSLDTPLTEVARTMARRRVGSAMVMEKDELRGIVTVTDALMSLAELADGVVKPGAPKSLPSRIRRRILSEHAELEKLLANVKASAERALTEDESGDSDDTTAGDELRTHSRELYRSLLRHMDLEDRVLVPALMEAPTQGKVKVQAETMVNKHKSQREQLQMALTFADSSDIEHLARSMLALVTAVREDMQDEEAELLSADALYDGLVAHDISPG